jgi:hypothetical protein
VQLIRIVGPKEPMRLLGEVAGLDFERTSATRLDDDRWRISGYATDEALAELQARGLSIELVVDNAQLEEQRTQLYARLEADADDPGDGSEGEA